MPRLTVALPARILSHLDELCELLGTTREQVLTSLIEQAHTERAHLATDACPWTISRQAISDYMAIAGCDALTADAALEAAAVDAATAENEGRRAPQRQANGALRYRGPQPRRLVLFVQEPQASADTPTLVAVSRGGATHSRRHR